MPAVAVSRRSFLRGSAGVFGVLPVAATVGVSLPRGSAPTAQQGNVHLVETHPVHLAERPAVHGLRGLPKPPGALPTHLHVAWAGGSSRLGRWELDTLARVDQVTEHRCADGWSAVVQWSGFRLADVLQLSGAPSGRPLTAQTPDAVYRVDLASDVVSHPQTLLADHMGGLPLDTDHGAPWRLVIPILHARFSLKRVGAIRLR